jgi:alpha-galactosidase
LTKEPVGRSAEYKGPIQDYEEYEGSVGDRRIVFIGASYKFVHRVLRDLLLVGGFNEIHVVVHDIDPVPLKKVSDLLERIARQKETNLKVTATLDREEALAGADAVILSITTGGKEADFRSFEVCARHGIPVGIGDTLGPAALARNLRTIPVAVEIAKDMERLCPEAVLLNFTNPMSAITGALLRHSEIQTFGLCHSGDELFQFFANVFQVKKSEVRLSVGGVNHQSFVTELLIRGEDRTPEILEATLASGTGLEDSLLGKKEEVNLQQDIHRILGVWPSTGADHLAEFYEYFLTTRRASELGLASHLKKVIPGRQPFGRTPCPEIIDYWAYGPEPVGDLHLLTEEHAHELLWSYFTGEEYTRVLNILNAGECVRNLPPEACVEVLATVAGRKVSAEPVELPGAANSLVSRWVTIHDLSIRAALDCDRDAARQALFLDAHVTDLYDIESMLEDFIAALEEWLPEGWTNSDTAVRR